MPKYTAREIAHYTVDKCMRDGQPISNLQLQKIMYLMQLEYCREHGDLLFFDEFEAWQYGPVLPEIYDEFSFFGGMRIEKTYDNAIRLEDPDKATVDRVICDKRTKYPWDLVKIAHAPNSPWDIAFRKGNRTTIQNPSLFAYCGS